MGGKASVYQCQGKQAYVNKNVLVHMTSPVHKMMLVPCRESNNVLLLLWQPPCLSFKISCQCHCRSLHAQSCPNVSFALISTYGQLCMAASEMHEQPPHSSVKRRVMLGLHGCISLVKFAATYYPVRKPKDLSYMTKTGRKSKPPC